MFAVKPEGNISLRIPRHRWKNNTEIDLKETGCLVNSSGSGLGSVVVAGMNSRQTRPYKLIRSATKGITTQLPLCLLERRATKDLGKSGGTAPRIL
jgi:hypothetical protein